MAVLSSSLANSLSPSVADSGAVFSSSLSLIVDGNKWEYAAQVWEDVATRCTPIFGLATR
jgi:hypothetical protein